MEEKKIVESKAGVEIPALLTVSPSPHIKHPDTTRTLMLDVVLALLPAAVWGVYSFGLRVLLVIAACVVSAVLAEAMTQLILRRPVTVSDCSAVVTGLLLALNLPATVPLWMCVIGSCFAIIVVKQLFGGLGKNFVNPALAARILLFAWPAEMTFFTAPGTRFGLSDLTVHADDVDIVAAATPLASLKSGLLPEVSLFKMIFGEVGGCIGEVSSILLLAGFVYLLMRRVISWHIPVAYVGTVALITFFLPAGGNGLDFMLAEVFSGGLLLGAIYMATDYTTSPITTAGRLIYGVGCGLLTVFIRYFGGYPEGVSFSILIMNALVWYLDRYTRPKRFGGRKNAA
ncbi:MAG: RnfABCDGE type electron transport complex subunit D [Clostridia bacterium]|nr:RnfABCDGE type electron transport complex subunit D [Clostridia bacterium]